MLKLLVMLLMKKHNCKVKPKDAEQVINHMACMLYQENQKNSCALFKKLYAIGKRESEK